MSNTRIERDSMGELQVPAEALYGAQTQRAVNNFPISNLRMPTQFIRALLLAKAAAAHANLELEQITAAQSEAIVSACQELLSGDYMAHFPVDVFQTGSGTSTNMNANEVIATLASRVLGDKVNANDHVNCGQSSNDIIPTTIHVSAALALHEQLLPALNHLVEVIERKADEVHPFIKTGRTHLMDAMPVRMSQVLNGWAQQLKANITLLQGLQARQQRLDVFDIGANLLSPAIEYLAHAYRHGVHQVRAAGLDERMYFIGLALDHLHQMRQRWQQLFMQRQRGTHVDGGRNDVVAALPAVDVIVGVDLVAEYAAGQGCDHFVGVHVGAGAGTGLKYIYREVRHVVAAQQFLASANNRLTLPDGNLLQLQVGMGGSGLGEQQCTNELRGHAQVADGEVIHRTLSLGAIQRLRRDL